jgi:hypothetical protein
MPQLAGVSSEFPAGGEFCRDFFRIAAGLMMFRQKRDIPAA